MSKKKKDIDDEITRLCSEGQDASPAPESSQGIQAVFSELLKQQASQHGELMKTLTSANEAVVSAVKGSIEAHPAPKPPAPRPPAQPSGMAQIPVRAEIHPVPRGLFSYEADEEEPDYSSGEDQYDFHGWDVPPSGQVSYDESASTAHCSSQAPTAAEPPVDPPADHPFLIEGLFNEYDQMPNWRVAPEIFTWLEGIVNKEVPSASMKAINESFIPELKYQHLFNTPVLPQAITDRLKVAPKNLARVPKIVNDTLIRAVS